MMWKHLPPGVIEEQILVRGGAFRMEYEFGGEGKKNRYFFILNLDPKAETILVVTTATTRIAERTARRPPEVLVEISPGEYPDLGALSLVDCESAMTWEKSHLVRSISRKSVQPLSPLPEQVMARLALAIAGSKTLSPKVKRLVLGQL